MAAMWTLYFPALTAGGAVTAAMAAVFALLPAALDLPAVPAMDVDWLQLDVAAAGVVDAVVTGAGSVGAALLPPLNKFEKNPAMVDEGAPEVGAAVGVSGLSGGKADKTGAGAAAAGGT